MPGKSQGELTTPPESPSSSRTIRSRELRALELGEIGGGRPVPPVLPIGPYGLCGRKATLKKTTEKIRNQSSGVEVAVLGSLSLTVLTVSVVVKQH